MLEGDLRRLGDKVFRKYQDIGLFQRNYIDKRLNGPIK